MEAPLSDRHDERVARRILAGTKGVIAAAPVIDARIIERRLQPAHARHHHAEGRSALEIAAEAEHLVDAERLGHEGLRLARGDEVAPLEQAFLQVGRHLRLGPGAAGDGEESADAPRLRQIASQLQRAVDGRRIRVGEEIQLRRLPRKVRQRR